MINFHKKTETYWVTGVPPITKNPLFLSVMRKFNCEIEAVEPYNKGTGEVCFYLTATPEEYENAKDWIEVNADSLRKDK